MRKYYLILAFILSVTLPAATPAFAQSGVFNPNDTLVNFNPSIPPSNPPNNNLVYKWGRTPTLGWNTSAWKAYYYNGMAFRIIFPPDYQSNPTKTFPLMVFFHGDGETGPVYNNELQLANCGRTITANVQSGNFDGFVIFPQTPFKAWVSTQFTIIAGLIDSMISEARVDPNRIIASGLSSGGDACWRFVDQFPNLVAAATPISAATALYVQPSFINTIKDVPFWISQGGLDQNPTPALTTGIVSTLVDSGMDIQTVAPGTEGTGRISEGYYIIYPNNGHNTWDAHYGEPEAWSYMMKAYKSNPHVYFGKRSFCPGDTINVKLEVTSGFAGYQWANNGVIIPNATTNTITVIDTGTYSARVLNNGVWSDWSHTPANISYTNLNQKTPAIAIAGMMSRVIPAPDGNTSVNLTSPSGYSSYAWRNASGQVVGTAQTFNATSPGGYVAIVSPSTGCSLQPSDTFYVVSNIGPNPPDAATDLNAFAVSQTSVQLNWSRNLHPVNKETGFEIYRGTRSGGPYQLAGIVPADTVQFTDNNLMPNTKYFYIVRAIDSTGAAPVSKQDSVTTFVDNQPPTAPGNLVELGATPNSVSLQWNPSTDNVAVQNYYVYINGVRSYVTSNTTFTVNGLSYKEYYTFTVKAVDPSGNISSPSNQVIAVAANHGLKYKYYVFSGFWNSIPNLSTLTPVDSSWINNISLSPATQTTDFAFSFTGYINIRKAGIYTFYTNSDDGSNLYINGTQVVNNDGQHGAQQKSGTYNFTQAGLYPFEVDYFQQGGAYSLSVLWQASSAGIPMSTIPDSAFIEIDSLQGSAPSMPTGITASAVSYKQINLTWTDNSNNETGFEIYRSNSATGPWQIIFTTKPNITVYSDSSLSPSTTYYYEVQSINQYGGSGFATQTSSDSATTRALPAAPPVPGKCIATTVSISQINLKWADTSANVNNFDIYRSDGDSLNFRMLQQVPANTLAFADSGLFPNTTYYYKVSAVNLGGVSGYSNTSYATTFNQAPVITGIRNQYVRYDTTVIITLSAVDSDGDALTFGAFNLPVFGTLHDNGNGTGTLSFSPSANQLGNYSNIKIYAIDQYGSKDSTVFNLTVGTNYPPVITPVAPLQVNTFNSVNDTVFVTERNANATVTWQTSNLPAFVNTATTNNGNLVLRIQPGTVDSGDYSFSVSATDNYGGSDRKMISLKVNFVPLKKWYINFATNFGWMSYPGSPWNNVRSDTANNLTDNQGNSSRVGIQFNTNWWATQMAGAVTGNNSGVYSDTVMRDDYYFGILGGPDSVSGAITGLDTTKTYSVTFFGSSNWQGTSDNGYTVYQIGARKDSIHVQNNTTQAVTFSSVIPSSNGSIPFTMSLGVNTPGGFVNAMTVSTDTKASPAKPLNIQVSNKTTDGNNAVQVNWQLGSTNASTIAVYRSTRRNGSYNLIDPDTLNGYQTSYTDGNVLADSTYFYYLMAVNAYGSSVSTDTVSITIPQYVDNRKWYINFATNFGWMPYPGSPWNNVRSDTANNLTDNQGNSSRVGIRFNTNWWATQMAGAVTGNNSGVYSDTVMRDDYYFGILGGPNSVSGAVTGLDTTKTYSVTFFGSSNWQGTSDNGYTVYQIGARKDSIHVQNNMSKTVTFSNLTPSSNGSIPFTMSLGVNTPGGFINAIVVSTYANYPPASPINVQLKNKLVNNKPAVEVDWQLGSNNTDSVKIYRTTSQTGVYTLLNQSMSGGNTASYIDTTVAVGGNYYYYLVSSNIYGNSRPTDTLYAMITNLLPATPQNLQLSNVVTDSSRKNAVRLNWQLGASGADTIAVYRSTSKGGTYTLLNPGVANVDSTSYMDTSVALSTIYYYYLQAKNIFGISAPTDTATITTIAAPLPPMAISPIPNIYVSGGAKDTIPISVSNSGSGVTSFGLQHAPPFITIQQIDSSSAKLVIAPQSSDYGTYDSIEVIARTSIGTSASAYFNAYITSGGVSQVIKMDFTNAGNDYYTGSWNNLNYSSAANNQFNNLINNFGQQTPISVTTVTPWTGVEDFGANTYNNSGFVPDSVMASYYYVSDTAARTIQIAGLDTTMRYNFVFFASSNYGGNTDYTTKYGIKGQTVTLNGIQNTSKTVRINGVQPNSSGAITISIAMGSTASKGILNAMIMEGYKNGTIVAPANLNAVAGNNNVNLTWSDRSYNEQQLQVWRSLSQNATYTIIASLPAGSSSYVDNTVSPDTRYFYKIIATDSSAASLSSNVASVTTPQLSVYVNFDYQEAPAPAPWNNTQTFPQAGNVWGPFLDNNGNNTGITLNMITNFEGEYPTGAVTGNNSGVYPDAVIMGQYYSDNGMDTIVMKVSSLDLSKLYDITFFSSVTGFGTTNTTLFIVNNQKVGLEASYNSTHTATLSRLIPDNTGIITVKIICTPQSRYAILNAMVIKQYDNYDSNGNKVINPNLLMYNRVKNGLELNSKLGIGPADTTSDDLQLAGNVYPNPFEQMINLAISSPRNGMLIMTMVNVNGQVVDRKTQAVSVGYNRIQYMTKAGLAPGMYVLSLRMESSRQVIHVKLIKGQFR